MAVVAPLSEKNTFDFLRHILLNATFVFRQLKCKLYAVIKNFKAAF